MLNVGMIWQQFFCTFMVLLNGPVQNALFGGMAQYRNVCLWFMARTISIDRCRFRWLPQWVLTKLGGTNKIHSRHSFQECPGCHIPHEGADVRGKFLCCANGNASGHSLKGIENVIGPLQSSRKLSLGRGPEEVLEPRKSFHVFANCRKPGHTGSVPWACKRSCRFPKGAVANVGTTGYHCKELPVPRGWNYWFPTSEPWVTIASNCRLPGVGTHASQPGTHRLPFQELEFLKAGTDGSQHGNLCALLQGTAGSQTWNLWFPTSELEVFIARNYLFREVRIYIFQS